MNTGDESKPSINRPHSSFVVGFIGPSNCFIPFCCAQFRAAANSSRLTRGSFTLSKKPKNAILSAAKSYGWFPLTPALSLRERENRPRAGSHGASRLVESLAAMPPLCKGEGRGENSPKRRFALCPHQPLSCRIRLPLLLWRRGLGRGGHVSRVP